MKFIEMDSHYLLTSANQRHIKYANLLRTHTTPKSAIELYGISSFTFANE